MKATAMGKAMLRVALVFAQLEREQTSERIGCPTRTRTSNNGTKNRCVTITPWGKLSLIIGEYRSLEKRALNFRSR